MPATYTENLTLVPGVNLTAWGCDGSQGATGNVKIIGKLTFTTAGTVNIYGIQLQTNSDYCIEVTGSAVSLLELTNCYINCINNTGIHITSSGTGAYVSLLDCNGDIATTGISLFTQTNGTVFINDCFISNSGNSVTDSTISGGLVSISYSRILFSITSSSTGIINISYSKMFTNTLNITNITSGGTTTFLTYSQFNSGSASCFSVGSGSILTIDYCILVTTDPNPVVGLGTCTYVACFFNTASAFVNSSTVNARTLQGLIGNSPAVGSLGQQIRGYNGTPVALTTATVANITSISLTAGTWDVSCICSFTGTPTGTQLTIAISDTTASLPSVTLFGDNTVSTPLMPTIGSDTNMSIPSLRVFITATTTYYMVALGTFTVGTISGYGRISATRVG